jgi:hypothetical protein
MSKRYTVLPGSGAFRGRTLLRKESFVLMVLIWGCVLLYAFSANALVRGAESDFPRDRFVQKLQLPRNPESVLQQVLSRSEFKESKKEHASDSIWTLMLDVLKKVLKWIRNRIPKIKFSLPRTDLEYLWIALASFVVATVLVLAAVFIFRATRSLGWETLQFEDDEELSSFVSIPSRTVKASAFKSAEQGNFQEALIIMFRYVLLCLDEHGKLSLHQVKTNREVLESLGNDTSLRSTLAEMIPIFNRVRYGSYACDKNDYEKFLALCSRVDGGM